MKQLPVVAFAAAVSIWGLASIPAASVKETSLIDGIKIPANLPHRPLIQAPVRVYSTPRNGREFVLARSEP
jgi:hypothetical protein